MFLWNGTPGGPLAAPGNYAFVVKMGNDSIRQDCFILPDQILRHQWMTIVYNTDF